MKKKIGKAILYSPLAILYVIISYKYPVETLIFIGVVTFVSLTTYFGLKLMSD